MYDTSNYGCVKTAIYDVSLYCATECGDVSNTSYECAYVWRNFNVRKGYKEVSASVVGCYADGDRLGRVFTAFNHVNYSSDHCAGGFSIGNPSLQPTHGSDSGATEA